ncbi:helix-turn-helix transcriptional regulator [Pseudomonas aeruginosa]|uniref:helix-turn-helix domain-containing protein n=1 Tax=Pseudomonas aeruginosa TaxID=287 RepID=UPI0022738EAE|nr:helix-turn-helix transcriptional regulator [Pseudomonas aeruginosa]EKV3164714.1 helix-turn-helix transcriptional regulator [Pseudomonas aeruginosa]EKW6216202.1 helix-turn-helix transcriptional regulator [Pseudomonas aeruginosa]EKW7605887.1 helix-turn-helix transcriptional regulator [Pseudomonas aeruginosa]ELL1222338.1 helix-turn-helix transcriptional regulator [Pseudomonas aeruginosa]
MRIRKHNQAFGRALRQLRKRRNMTQEILGFEAVLDRTYISVLERGERSPTLDTLVSLCDVLGLSLPELAIHVQTQLDEMHDDEHDPAGRT